MTVLVVNWMAEKGNEQKVIDVFSKLAAASRQEPGCRQYSVLQHRDNPRHFFVFEVYDNEAALQAHRDSQHFKQYATKDLPALGTRVDGNFFTPVA